MEGASGEGEDRGGDEVPILVLMEENMRLALLTIAQSVPYLWPVILNSEWEFPSICIAGRDYELAYLAQRPTITLRLRDEAAWSAARPGLMEMRLGKRIFPTLNVCVEGLHAYELYTIFLDLMPLSQNVYKYQDGLWTPLQTTKLYPPTYRACHYSSQIFVHRGQIYLPRYHIVRHFTEADAAVRLRNASLCRNVLLAPLEYIGTYVIPGTAFVAVNNYYSRRISSLKIEARRSFAH
ncbi:unnamed protein product [Taenia asiatica]|uniref:T-box domain-containing protein n=1 Tax=Taenia asiatica TaxID=60517 RepID=A0A0R3WFN2_TAEAS|nr:unnamed protein product [Taenia asiatica]